MVEWQKIKAEYIAGGTSYRKLAEKYVVPRSNIERKAKEEKWTELRRQAECKAEAKIVDAISKKGAKRANKIIDVADKLLDKISDLINEVPLDTQSIKHLTSAVKDLKEIKGFKSDADTREQEARIRNLEKQVEKNDGDDKPSGILILPSIAEMPSPPTEDADG